MSDHLFTHALFQRHLDEGKLIGARCKSCGYLLLPPRSICPHCFSEALEPIEMGGRGALIAFTAVHIAPTAMVKAGYGPQNPYVTGIVQLEEGPAISARIIGVDPRNPYDIQIGVPVTIAFLDSPSREHKVLAFEVIA